MSNINITNIENLIENKLDLSLLDKEGSQISSNIIFDIIGFNKKDIVIFLKGLYLMIFDELEVNYNLISFSELFKFDLDFLEIKDIVHRYVYGHIEFSNNEDTIKQKELELSLTYIFITLLLDIHRKIDK